MSAATDAQIRAWTEHAENFFRPGTGSARVEVAPPLPRGEALRPEAVGAGPARVSEPRVAGRGPRSSRARTPASSARRPLAREPAETLPVSSHPNTGSDGAALSVRRYRSAEGVESTTIVYRGDTLSSTSDDNVAQLGQMFDANPALAERYGIRAVRREGSRVVEYEMPDAETLARIRREMAGGGEPLFRYRTPEAGAAQVTSSEFGAMLSRGEWPLAQSGREFRHDIAAHGFSLDTVSSGGAARIRERYSALGAYHDALESGAFDEAVQAVARGRDPNSRVVRSAAERLLRDTELERIANTLGASAEYGSVGVSSVLQSSTPEELRGMLHALESGGDAPRLASLRSDVRRFVQGGEGDARSLDELIRHAEARSRDTTVLAGQRQAYQQLAEHARESRTALRPMTAAEIDAEARHILEQALRLTEGG
jgi:hypothetical protein